MGQQFVDLEGSEGHCDVVYEGDKKVAWRRPLFTPYTTAQTHLPRNAGFTCTGAAREKVHEYELQQQSNSVQQLKVESW